MAAPLCLIPARGGSKRVRRKNARLLAGKPLISWSIETAMDTGIFSDVVVSSDDEELLEIALQRGATPMQRPAALAGDGITVNEVSTEVVRQLVKAGRRYDAVYVLMPTSPFRRAETIRAAWSMFEDRQAPSLASASQLPYPVEWVIRIENGRMAPLFPDRYHTPRQQLEPAYVLDGAHMICRVDELMHRGVLVWDDTIVFPTPPDEAHDIDTERDFAIAEWIAHRLDTDGEKTSTGRRPSG